MRHPDTYIALWGRRFHPSRLKIRGNFEVVGSHDPGDVGTKGRYRGQKIPYGSCDIRCVKSGRNIGRLAQHVRKKLSQYKAAGATNITFWILWRGVQGNTELSVRELSLLAATHVPLAMDYIWSEEEQNPESSVSAQPDTGLLNPESSVSAQPDTGLLLNKPGSKDAPR